MIFLLYVNAHETYKMPFMLFIYNEYVGTQQRLITTYSCNKGVITGQLAIIL